nr:ricin-type beta-trefoil lectin domain protein [uncultured Actinoplanes sp.]
MSDAAARPLTHAQAGEPPAAVQPAGAADVTVPAVVATSVPAGSSVTASRPGAAATGNPAGLPPAPGATTVPRPGVPPVEVTTNPTARVTTAQAPVVTKATNTPAAVGKQVSNFATETCLDLSGSTVRLWQCQGTDDQKVSFPSDGTMRILGKCVQINGNANGSRLSAVGCDGSNAQQFRLNKAYDLVSVKVDRCVDVPDSDPGNGVPAQIWDCAGTGNQKWHY